MKTKDKEKIGMMELFLILMLCMKRLWKVLIKVLIVSQISKYTWLMMLIKETITIISNRNLPLNLMKLSQIV